MLLSDRQRKKILKKHKIYITRKCDMCEEPLTKTYNFSGKDGVGEYCSQDCCDQGIIKQVNYAKLNKRKGKHKVAKKSASASEELSKSSESKSASASASASSESKSSEKGKKAVSKKEKETKTKKSSGKDKKEHKSSKKDSKKSDKKVKKENKDSKPKSKTGKEGNYREGSNIAKLYERLAKGKTLSRKELAKGIDGDINKPLNRLTKHGMRSGKWTLTTDNDNGTFKMKLSGRSK